MLNVTTISAIQAVLGITNLAELIAAEEENSIEVPVLFTEAQKNAFGTNRFNEGKKAFGQIWTKDMKDKYPNVIYDGKTPEIFMDKFAELKVSESGDEPDKKVAKYKLENEELKGKLQTSIDSVDGIKSDYENKLFGLSANTSISASIPNDTIIPRGQVLTIFNSIVSTQKDEDGKVFHSRGGVAIKDEVGDYKPTSTVVSEFIDEMKYTAKGGMGGGDGGDPKVKTTYKNMSSFMSGMEKAGIEPMSNAGQKILIESKKSPDFDADA